MAAAYAVGVQREEPRVLKGFLMFISGQAHSTVPPAELPTWTTSATPFGRAHKQRLTLLTVLTLKMEEGEIISSEHDKTVPYIYFYVFY